jgi:hypothetical protein
MKIHTFYKDSSVYQTINDLFLLGRLFVWNITIAIAF